MSRVLAVGREGWKVNEFAVEGEAVIPAHAVIEANQNQSVPIFDCIGRLHVSAVAVVNDDFFIRVELLKQRDQSANLHGAII